MGRGAALVAEDRMLTVRPVPGLAAVAPVQVARKLQAPVPAPRRLEQVARDASHRPQLRGGRLRTGFPQGLRHPVVRLELAQRRAGADGDGGGRSCDSARNGSLEPDELVRGDETVAKKRNEIRPTGERLR